MYTVWNFIMFSVPKHSYILLKHDELINHNTCKSNLHVQSVTLTLCAKDIGASTYIDYHRLITAFMQVEHYSEKKHFS